MEESSVSAPTLINSRELIEGRNPAAVSQRSSLTENSESNRKGSSKSLPGGESHLETTRQFMLEKQLSEINMGNPLLIKQRSRTCKDFHCIRHSSVMNEVIMLWSAFKFLHFRIPQASSQCRNAFIWILYKKIHTWGWRGGTYQEPFSTKSNI